MTDREKLAVLAVRMGDDVGMVIKVRSLTVPAWRRRFVFHGGTGDLRLVQNMRVIADERGRTTVEYTTVGRG